MQGRLAVVLEELKFRYTSNLDRPESHLSLGILCENLGEPREAEKHYRNAMVRDELFVPARLNLATLLSGQGRNEEAEKFLRESVHLQPTWGQIHYSLGLLLAEDRARLSEAIRSLERAAGFMPENPRVTYNLGIAYWQSQRVGMQSGLFFIPSNCLLIIQSSGKELASSTHKMECGSNRFPICVTWLILFRNDLILKLF